MAADNDDFERARQRLALPGPLRRTSDVSVGWFVSGKTGERRTIEFQRDEVFRILKRITADDYKGEGTRVLSFEVDGKSQVPPHCPDWLPALSKDFADHPLSDGIGWDPGRRVSFEVEFLRDGQFYFVFVLRPAVA